MQTKKTPKLPFLNLGYQIYPVIIRLVGLGIIILKGDMRILVFGGAY
jgi:hypothetical protein